MKNILAPLLIIGIALPQASLAQDSMTQVDCAFESPRGTTLSDGEFSGTTLQFGDADLDWSYSFTFLEPAGEDLGSEVTVSSDQDLARIAGQYGILRVAQDTYVINAIRGGGCMFSSQICGAFVQLTDIKSDGASASMTPISYASLRDSEQVSFLHIVLLGQCQTRASSEATQ